VSGTRRYGGWLYRVVTPEGETSNRHEGYLALIEAHAAPAIGRMIADPESLQPGDRATIAFFVAFQTMRTPAAAEQVTALANAAFQNAASELFSDREAFAERYRQRVGADAPDEKIEEFRKEVIKAVRTGTVRVTGDGGAEFASGFVASDRGYAIDDPSPPFHGAHKV